GGAEAPARAAGPAPGCLLLRTRRRRNAAASRSSWFPSVPGIRYNNGMLTVEAHPLLDLRAFVTQLPRPLGAMPSPPDLQALLALDAAAPLRSDDAVREAVRQLLRHGGFKPTGRSKPASEYLLRAVGA